MAGLFKSIFNNVCKTFGLTIIANWRFDQYAQEQYLRKIINTFGVDLILDVGANTGQYASFLRHGVGFRGRIVSYEPDPDVAARAEQRFAGDGLWSMTRAALGPEPGTARFNLMAGSELSSFLTPSTEALQRYGSANQVTRTIEVEVRTVAAEVARLMAEHGCTRPYLKLDTQGFDLQVLAGTGAALRQLVGIQSEMSVMPIYQGMPDIAESLACLRSMGFELSAVFPVSSRHFPLLIEVDGHFVRNDLLEPARRQTRLPSPGRPQP